MAQILIRNVDKKLVESLKSRAERRGHSMQAEAKEIIESAVAKDWRQFAVKAALIRAQIAKHGPQKTDSTDLIREDRDR